MSFWVYVKICIIRSRPKQIFFLSHLKRKEMEILDMTLKDKGTKGIKYVSCTCAERKRIKSCLGPHVDFSSIKEF